MENKKSNIKKRNWGFVIYPESMPKDWKEKLQITGLECAISPLHDKDINPTGEKKKAHYHCIVCYSGPTSYSVVKRLTDSLNAPGPIALEQVKGYYRYLTHKDNPEKAQYKEEEIIFLNGFNIKNFTEMTKSEVFEIKSKIQTLIREKDILEYSCLLDYLQDNSLLQELEVAQNNTMLFNSYIKSRRYSSKRSKKVTDEKIIKIDTETGEVIE